MDVGALIPAPHSYCSGCQISSWLARWSFAQSWQLSVQLCMLFALPSKYLGELIFLFNLVFVSIYRHFNWRLVLWSDIAWKMPMMHHDLLTIRMTSINVRRSIYPFGRSNVNCALCITCQQFNFAHSTILCIIFQKFCICLTILILAMHSNFVRKVYIILQKTNPQNK